MAQVAERLVARVLDRLADGAAVLREVPPADSIRRWVELVYDTVARERGLVGVFTYQVPYSNDIEAVRATGARLLAFSEALHARAGDLARPDISRAEMQLIVNLTSSTILQLVLEPPDGLDEQQVLNELGRRLEQWIR